MSLTALTVNMLSGIGNTVLPNKVSAPLHPSPEPEPKKGKLHLPFIFCEYKTLSKPDLQLLVSYGTVLRYANGYGTHSGVNCYKNRDPNEFVFDYLILNFRVQEERIYFQKYILPHHDHYHIILFRYPYETNNGIKVHNELTKLPLREAFAEDFNRLLLQEEIYSPRCCISLYRVCCGNTTVQIS
jgi:hypothetical protein